MIFSPKTKFMYCSILYASVFLMTLIFFVPAGLSQDLSVLSKQEMLNYKKAVSCFKHKDYRKSMDILNTLFINHPDNKKINFLLGRSAFEAGEYETALSAFDRIRIANPENNRVKLEMARTYFKMGAMKQALILFNDVLASNPPERVKANINKYIDFIKKSEKNNFLNGYISFGVARDDNVYANPSHETIAVPALGDLPVNVGHSKLDAMFPFGAGFSHRYHRSGEPWFWQNFLQTYNTRYCKAHDFEVNYIGFTTGIGYRFNQKSQIEILPEVYSMTLDDKRYSSALGISTKFHFTLNKSSRAGITALIRKKEFHQNHDRNAIETSILLNHMFKLGKMWVVPKITGKNELASDDQYSYKRMGCGLTLSRLIFKKINCSLGYTFEYEKYKEKDSLFNKKRRTKIHYIVANISRNFKLGNDWVFTAGISHTWESDHSNIAVYRYRRNITQFYIRFNF